MGWMRTVDVFNVCRTSFASLMILDIASLSPPAAYFSLFWGGADEESSLNGPGGIQCPDLAELLVEVPEVPPDLPLLLLGLAHPVPAKETISWYFLTVNTTQVTHYRYPAPSVFKKISSLSTPS